MKNSRTWVEAIAPITKKLELSITLDMNCTFSPDGATALLALLKQMAEGMDYANEIIEERTTLD